MLDLYTPLLYRRIHIHWFEVDKPSGEEVDEMRSEYVEWNGKKMRSVVWHAVFGSEGAATVGGAMARA